MARYALIKNGEVQNVIVAEPEVIGKLQLDADEVKLLPDDSDVGIDHIYDGQRFEKKPEPEPEEKPPSLEERLATMEAELAAIKADNPKG